MEPHGGSKLNGPGTQKCSSPLNEAPYQISAKLSKRERAGTDTQRPTLKKPRVEPEITQSTAAADPAKDATGDAQSHPSASQLKSATYPLQFEEAKKEAATEAATQPPATPDFEWIYIGDTPENFLTRLQIRSFLLLFRDLAPPGPYPEDIYSMESQVLSNPAIAWTGWEMNRIGQLLLSIVGEILISELADRYKSRASKFELRNIELLKSNLRRGLKLIGVTGWWSHFCAIWDYADMEPDKSSDTVGSPCERSKRENATSRNRGRGGRNRNRKMLTNDHIRVAVPTAKYFTYEQLQQILIFSCRCPEPRKRLQENEEKSKKNRKTTKMAIKALRSDLAAIKRDTKNRRKVIGGEEPIKENLDKLRSIQTKISRLSLTEWLELQKRDPRSCQPIGKDPLGNVYYIMPHDGELEGYASWVLCQKQQGLKHPLGEDWVQTRGDGGTTKNFYAIDGVQAIRVLVGWIQEKICEETKSIGPDGPQSLTYDVLIEKLQQFAQILQLNDQNAN